MNDRYSNFTEGFFKSMIIAYGGLAFGVFSLYKLGQGDKKYLQILAGAAVGLYGAKHLESGGFRKKKNNNIKAT